VDGKAKIRHIQLEPQPKPDWDEEVENVMAQQELTRLQQSLGLVAPKNGKPVEDVVFVCIDIEAFESDQSKITEIGESSQLLEFGDQD
jgi:predicted N-acetyltransferase YhbS